MINSYLDFWLRGLNFYGRSTRSDFWWVFVVDIILYLAICFVSLLPFCKQPMGLFTNIYLILSIIPNIALDVRRLHDINLSGWWYLLCLLIPLLPFIFALIPSSPNSKYSY